MNDRAAAAVLALLWAAMPLYPSFIGLVPIAPPGLSVVPPGAAYGLLTAVGVLTVISLIVSLRAGAAPLFRDRLSFALYFYVASALVCGAFGFLPRVGMVYAVIMVCCIIGMNAVRLFGVQPLIQKTMTQALLISCSIASAYALFAWCMQTPAQLYAIGNGRAIGTFVVPGELAGYLGMLLPFALGIALVTASRNMRALALGTILLGAIAMLVTFSRAGIFGLIVGCTILAARFGRKILTRYIVISVCVLATLGVIAGNAHHNPAENFNRPSIWAAAVRAFALFPATGTGLGGFHVVYPYVALPGGEPGAFHAHNLPLTIAVEMGMLGLTTFGFTWIAFGQAFLRAWRRTDTRGRTLGAAIAAGFIGTWVQSMVDVVQVLVLGVWIPFMGMALSVMTQRESAP